MSSWVRRVIGGVAVAAFVGFGPAAPRVEAAPVLVAEYVETSLGAGLFQYDYTLHNQADTILDAGFLDTFSLVPGASPTGADIGPGQPLGTFLFVFDGQVGSASVGFAGVDLQAVAS